MGTKIDYVGKQRIPTSKMPKCVHWPQKNIIESATPYGTVYEPQPKNSKKDPKGILVFIYERGVSLVRVVVPADNDGKPIWNARRTFRAGRKLNFHYDRIDIPYKIVIDVAVLMIKLFLERFSFKKNVKKSVDLAKRMIGGQPQEVPAEQEVHQDKEKAGDYLVDKFYSKGEF